MARTEYMISLPRAVCLGATIALAATQAFASNPAPDSAMASIQPIINEYCSDCHADGMDKGGVAFDAFKTEKELVDNHDLWLRVLKNVRAGIMPPAKKAQPTAEEMAALESWIKKASFKIDPENPDPGRVTLRRLNRVEYQNTIRDLMDVYFNTTEEFPPDDTGYGFDNIGDVLTISPLLLEKYLQAAEKIVSEGVPTVPRVVQERTFYGRDFRGKDGASGESMTFYKEAVVSKKTKIDTAGEYKLMLDLVVRGAFDFDPGRARVVVKAGGRQLLEKEFKWENGQAFPFEFTETWEPGEKELTLELHPLVKPEEKKTHVDLRINSFKIQGPLDPKHWTKTKNYDRFFPKEETPSDPEEKKKYATEILRKFATQAFRRPVDEKVLGRLVAIAEATWADPEKRFEHGIAQAMIATLASPRFLFRVEETIPASSGTYPLLDEYALASRLSYFLWSSMPDERLFELAGKGELRANLQGEIKRMLASHKANEFIENFSGQWLQIRDVEGIAINERAVSRREREPSEDDGDRRRRFGPPRAELDGELRRAMRQETEQFFAYVVREDRPVREMLDGKYTFLNEKLAKHYEIPNVEGREMRRVELPDDSPRGGVLTHGSILVVTSNPTRTSPVKRGLFILDNFLGTPPPPPPPDTPELEAAEEEFKGREPSLREALALHLTNPLCHSCHERMDPLGFALENFNALGMWRDKEFGQPVDPAGKLISGEEFKNVRELKKILAENHRENFYRTLAEKLLTYALGRGVEYYDVHTIDQVVSRMEKEEGRFSVLLTGIIESAPFQKRRSSGMNTAGVAQGAE